MIFGNDMMSKLKPLSITQVAVVVKDLRKTMETYHKMLGWGPWNVYVLKPPRHRDTFVRGKRVNYTMQIAETHVDSLGFEIIEPLEGPSIYREFLDEKGEGLHHIACMRTTTDADETLASFKKMGAGVLMGGSIDDSIRYYYLDTEPMLKLIVETGSGHAITLKADWTFP
jgi:methylmalonyl-CoA/ethylmalonyl-CoA epimerase